MTLWESIFFTLVLFIVCLPYSSKGVKSNLADWSPTRPSNLLLLSATSYSIWYCIVHPLVNYRSSGIFTGCCWLIVLSRLLRSEAT